MMTTLYFVRHAEAVGTHKDEATRPLTEKGRADCALVTRFFESRAVDAVIASHYRRASDTVRDMAAEKKLTIQTDERFRERAVGSGAGDMDAFMRRQWEDFSHRTPDGESLSDVRARCLAGIGDLLRAYDGKTVVVASHGTAMAVILDRYAPGFGYEGFLGMRNLAPWVVALGFEGERPVFARGIDLFSLDD